jgi:hypothetical protein
LCLISPCRLNPHVVSQHSHHFKCRIKSELFVCLCSAQFLFQDAVRARLGKEARAFQESRAGSAAAPYSMAAAQRLAADFRRLGDAPDGLSYLGHLRKLITGARSRCSVFGARMAGLSCLLQIVNGVCKSGQAAVSD